MKALCIGQINYNIVLKVDELKEQDEVNFSSEESEINYGSTINMALLLSKWGIDTSICGLMGNDISSIEIENFCKNNSIDTTYLKKDLSSKTDTSYIIKDKKDTSYTITSIKAKIHDLIGITMKPSIIILDGEELLTSLKVLENNPLALTILKADRLTDDINSLTYKTKYLICNKKFVESFTNLKIDIANEENLIDIYDEIQLRFKNNVIIYLEDIGSFTKIDNKYTLIKNKKLELNSNETLDIYTSALAYFLAKNYPLYEAITLANITSSLSKEKNHDDIYLLDYILKKANLYDII